jgi:hypothetical protein
MNPSLLTVKRWSLFLPLFLAFFILGCLVSETTEFTISMNDDGKSGTIVTVMRNIQSGEADGERQEKDFDEAIRAWKGDEYLLERMHDGLYVKDRNLSLEKSVLVWKETALFSDVSEVFKREITHDTLRFVIKDDQKIVATNGTVLSAKDSTVVFWALQGAREISLTTRADSFNASSDFAALFKQYIKEDH